MPGKKAFPWKGTAGHPPFLIAEAFLVVHKFTLDQFSSYSSSGNQKLVLSHSHEHRFSFSGYVYSCVDANPEPDGYKTQG
jgi:hypothetical protein